MVIVLLQLDFGAPAGGPPSAHALPGLSEWSHGFPVVGGWLFISFLRNGTSRTSPSRLDIDTASTGELDRPLGAGVTKQPWAGLRRRFVLYSTHELLLQRLSAADLAGRGTCPRPDASHSPRQAHTGP